MGRHECCYVPHRDGLNSQLICENSEALERTDIERAELVIQGRCVAYVDQGFPNWVIKKSRKSPRWEVVQPIQKGARRLRVPHRVSICHCDQTLCNACLQITSSVLLVQAEDKGVPASMEPEGG